MTTVKRRGSFLVCVVLLFAASCREPPVEKLYAVRREASPGSESWTAALPLYLKAGGGNLNGPDRRLAELDLDTDAVHVGSASCHHGPPITSPVFLEARAFYTGSEIQIEVRWEDPTEDLVPKSWEKAPGGWKLRDGDQDGIAILWSRAAGPFGCQEACHMRDFALRQGALIDLRAMFLVEKGAWEEVWIWKPASGAQALTLGERGFLTADGEIYRVENSAAAVDPKLRPEARRAGTFGPGDRPLKDAAGRDLSDAADNAPAYLFAGKSGGGGLVAEAEHRGGRWRVVFTRSLEAGEQRQAFRPGESYRFGIALFDATSTNHHIVRDTRTLDLVTQPPASIPRGEPSPGDRPDDAGIL